MNWRGKGKGIKKKETEKKLKKKRINRRHLDRLYSLMKSQSLILRIQKKMIFGMTNLKKKKKKKKKKMAM